MFAPHAREVVVVVAGDARAPVLAVADRVHDAGFYEAVLPDAPPARLPLAHHRRRPGTETIVHADPYSFGPILGELDLHLFTEGNHHRLYDRLGAHLCETKACAAARSPCGRRTRAGSAWSAISTAGTAGCTPCASCISGGVWEIFLPGVEEGAHYKFEVLGPQGGIQLKSDPFAFYNQHGLQTSSMVWDLGRYAWSDGEWMANRAGTKDWQKEPVSIYEVHLGSWKRMPEEGTTAR